MIDDTVFKVVLMVAVCTIAIFTFIIAIALCHISSYIQDGNLNLSCIKYYASRIDSETSRINDHSLDIYAETSTILKVNTETRNALKTTNEKLEKIRKQIDKR